MRRASDPEAILALRRRVRRALAPADRSLQAEIAAVLELAPLDFGGGCTPFKGAVIGQLLIAQRAQVIVEIGVLHGRGALALATAARRVQGAHVWGVDPYAAGAYPDAGQGHPTLASEIADWVAVFDFDRCCSDMLGLMQRTGLADRFTLIREPSVRAAEQFSPGSVDVLHIDGDHSREAVAADVAAWLPRVRPGGIVVFDDCSWPAIVPSAAAVQVRAETLFSLVDPEGRAGRGPADFLVLRMPAAAHHGQGG